MASKLSELAKLVPHTFHEHDWDRLVGQFVLAFGTIENVATSALRLLPADPIGETASELLLKQRLDLLEELLSPRSTAARSAFLDSLSAVKRYVKRRNVVAHNGVSFGIYKDGDRIAMTSSIRSSRGKQTHEVSHREMIELVKEVNALAAGVSSAYLDVLRDELDPEDVE
jgi:hypothetical protein